MAQAAGAGTPALPVPHMGQCLLDGNALPPLGPTLRGVLPRSPVPA
jgi:hypothetical protein